MASVLCGLFCRRATGADHLAATSPVAPCRAYADSGKATGYVVAAGVEYAIRQSISLRAEYSFLDLTGEKLYASTTAFGLLFETTTKPRLQTDQLTLGMNFRF